MPSALARNGRCHWQYWQFVIHGCLIFQYISYHFNIASFFYALLCLDCLSPKSTGPKLLHKWARHLEIAETCRHMVASTWRAVCSGMSKSCGSTALPSSPGCWLRAVRGFAFVLIFWFKFCASALGYKLSYKPIFCEETATKAFQPESGNFSSATTSSRRVTKPVKPLK